MKLTPHSDKSLYPDGTKKISASAQEIFDRKARDHGLHLTSDERNKIGLDLARAAEEAGRTPWIERFKEAGAPTDAELAELDAALAELAVAHADTEVARRLAADAERFSNELFQSGYWDNTDPEREMALARARRDAAVADVNFTRAVEVERYVDKRVTAARAAILRNGAARQVVHASNGL